MWEALQDLDRAEVEERMSDLLSRREIEALFERREKLVNHIQGMIDEWGELHILFDAEPPGEPAEWAGD